MSGSEKRRAPLLIGERLVVVAPGTAPVTGDDRAAMIIPLGAFGSGEHETTASCLEEVEQIASCAMARVLDVGCGTGVLAIAALLLGAEQAVGVDIGPRAVVTTRRAARLNRLEQRLVVILGSLDAVAPGFYDLVLANLHGDVLLSLAEALVAAARPSAHIVLSGIAWEYAFSVRQEFTGLGCGVVRERWLEEYVTLSLTAPKRTTARLESRAVVGDG